MSKWKTVSGLYRFICKTGKYWLLPLIFFLVLLGLLFVFAQGSVLAPFIYTIF